MAGEAGILGSVERVVKIWALLVLLPVVFTVRRLQFSIQPGELAGVAVVGALFLVTLLAGSVLAVISALEAIQRLNLRQ